MGWEQHRDDFSIPLIAASACGPMAPVRLSASQADTFVPMASAGEGRPFGITAASCNQGYRVAVYEEGNYLKAVAAASLGPGTPVIVGSPNGALAPASQAIVGSNHWEVGIAMNGAAAGNFFTVFVKPRKIV